jgi:hypothetical protein
LVFFPPLAMRPSFTSQDSFNNNSSPKYQSVLPKSALDIEVVSYHLLNDGLMYNDHIFIINIHCDSIYYSIERNYIDFVEFYLKIKKRFPSCEIPLLPLDGIHQVTKLINKDETRKINPESRKSLTSIPSFESPKKMISTDLNSNGNPTPPRSISRAGSSGGFRMDSGNKQEDLQSKIPELQIYMRTLLTFHEIVVSEEFYAFLDEERPCGSIFTYLLSEIPNEIDLLLVCSFLSKAFDSCFLS